MPAVVVLVVCCILLLLPGLPVTVQTVLGKTIHMIDPDRKVFVIDLLSPETCDEIRMMADNHTRNAKKDAEVWRTLYTYTKMDLPVVEGKARTSSSKSVV